MDANQNRAAVVRQPLVVPQLGIGGVPLTLSLWLVPQGAAVIEGDRVVELVAGGAIIDLESPVSGRLVSQCVDEDATVTAGTVIAEFEADSETPSEQL
jgi:pyruvate/2-oxoglutarate dehydrogenase complex dihydrolipoamide acyltransferase (E2) component